jgi:methionyl aminopeptidase
VLDRVPDRVRPKTPDQVQRMRRAGRVVGETLALLRAAAVPGTTPRMLDALAAEAIAARGATPSFLGYHGYPATICTSVNDVVVHGIPDDRPLADGDLCSIDCGAIVDGWHGDAAITVRVGTVTPADEALAATCELALAAGIAAMVPGGWLRDIGTAVEDAVRAAGPYGILEDYTGHGIGTAMHEEPFVPNVRTRRRGLRLVPGTVLAIEPMITAGDPAVETLADGWTVRTVDRARSAHAEHTVAVTEDGPLVLTLPGD